MSNLNLNKVIIGGRLTQEPELKTTQSGLSVVSFNIAVNRKAKQGEEQKADYFSVTAWRGTADFVGRYFHRGSSICIVGQLQNSSWEKDGQKHYRTDIIAEEVMFVDSLSERRTLAPTTNAPMPNFEEINSDEGLPF